jgi:type II secretion system (T2SS) protein N
MRGPLRIVAALLLLTVAAVALAPASLVDALAAAGTAGRVRVADTSGFWWRGHGVVTSQHARAGVPIAWRVRFLPLARGRLVVDLAAVQPDMPSGTLALSSDDVEAHDLRLTVPALLLPAFVPSLSALAPAGDIDIRTTSFTWNASVANGQLDATWRDARLAIAGFPVLLGRIAGSASGSGDRLGGAFDNTGGDLGIRGTWQVLPDATQATTTLTPTHRTPAALRALLPMLGRTNGNGSVEIDWRGRR